MPVETLTKGDTASVGEARDGVGEVSPALDIAATPSAARAKLPARRSAARGIERFVTSSPDLRGEHLGEIIAQRHDVLDPRRGVTKRGDEGVETRARLEVRDPIVEGDECVDVPRALRCQKSWRAQASGPKSPSFSDTTKLLQLGPLEDSAV